MPFRRVSNFVALPVILFLESMAWYGTRGIMSLYLQDLGFGYGTDEMDLGQLFTVMQWVTIGATLLGGVAAIAAGPLPVIILGLAMAGLGIAVIGVTPAELIYLPVIFAALGVGMFRPAIYGAAMIGLGYPREHLRGVLCLLLWASMNVGALLCMPVIEVVYETLGFTAAFAMEGVLVLLAAVLACGLGAVHLKFRTAEPTEPDTTRTVNGKLLAVLGGVLVLAAIPWGAYNYAYRLFYSGFYSLEDIWDYENVEWVFRINPPIVLLMALILTAVLLGLHFARVRLSSLLFVGLGLMGTGLALALLSAEPLRQSMGGLLAGLGLLSVVEVFVGPLIVSRLGGDVHWRFASAIIALWLVATGLVNELLNILPGSDYTEDVSLVFGFLLGAVSLLFGLVIAVAAIPLQRTLLKPDVEDPPQRTADLFDEGVLKERI